MALPFSGHGVTLGGLELVAWGEGVQHDGGFTTEISADGTTWGNPAVVVSSLISALSDGDIVQQQRTGNREPVLYVRIIGTDHHSLVAGDTALSAVVGPPCELVWQPPDPDAPPTVIDVVHSRMDHAWDDMDALKFERVWTVTMSALPWPRSANKVITEAVTGTAPTVVDDGSSTVGWSSYNGVVTTSGGAVVTTYDGSAGGIHGTALTLSTSIDTSVAKYLAVDFRSTVSVLHDLTVNGGGPQLAEVRREPAPMSGFTRSWYRVAHNAVSSVRLGVVHAPTTSGPTLSIDQVLLADKLPATGTARQLTRTILPGGNVPAEGTVRIEHPTDGLGQTIVYTHPAGGGYVPPLRQWLHSSDDTAPDPDAVSGYTNLVTGITDFRVPVDAVPEGDVGYWARLYNGSAGTVRIHWSASSHFDVGQFGDGQGGSTLVTWNTPGWQIVQLARLSLPTARIGPAGYVRVSLQRDAAETAGVLIDEAWLFAMDNARLTILDNGTGPAGLGGPANRVQISAPSLNEPHGSIMVGYSPDWSDSHAATSALVQCDQVGHRFDPNGSVIFTVTSGAYDAMVSLEHYPRWRAEAGL